MDTNSSPTPTTPVSASVTPVEANTSEKKLGPIVAVLIIVLVLVIAALYIFASRINDGSKSPTLSPNDTAQTSSQGASVKAVTNTSDDLQSLQNDLDNSTTQMEASAQ